MAEMFNHATWKSRAAAWWRDAAEDVEGTMRRLGVHTAYGLLAASAWLPLLAAYADDPGPAVAALAGVLSGVGTTLLSNLVQGAYDEATAPQKAEQELAEQPGLRAEYERILATLDLLAAAQTALGKQWAAFEAQLGQELARMGGTVRAESGGGAVVFGEVVVEHGDFVGRDKHEWHYHAASPPPDVSPLREAYLRHLAERCERLPLRGVRVQAGDATAHAEHPHLARVYVDLDTTAPRRTRRAGRSGRQTEAADDAMDRLEAMAGAEGGRPLSALEVTASHRRLVLLGAPGSGKSTFIRHLAFCLAMAQLEPQGDRPKYLAGWPAEEVDVLPVVVILRDFARWATAQGLTDGNARALGRFLEQWLADRDLGGFAEPMRQALRAGQAIVLFDGLDEIPTGGQRTIVRDAVADFARTYAEARVAVTCRTMSYHERAWQMDPQQFPAFQLAPFDEDKIDRFVEAWYRELADLRAVRHEDVESLAEKLRRAVRRADLWRLAPNPLLLTVMALVHAYQGRLPETRALLYEECTDMLLWRWEQVKWQAEQEDTPGLRGLLREAGLQDVDLKQALWALAFEVHKTAGGGDDDATADIPETMLLRTLRELHTARSWDWAAEVVRQIKERAGLLIEREPEIYAFPHRTFQEYLAGCHLSVQAEFAGQAAALLEEAAFWREAVLLAVGRQVHVAGDLARPLALVAELCPPDKPASEQGWRAAWLAGQVLLEVGVDRSARSALGRELLARTREHLAALVEGGCLEPGVRAEAGDVLGKLGDPRFDPNFYFLPGRFRGEPEPRLGFVEIPAGRSRIGTREEDIPALSKRYGGGADSYKDEVPEHGVDLATFYVARYPVTVAQYDCFVQSEGYEEAGWWTRDGWAWRRGQWDSQVQEEGLREWLRRRPSDQRGVPMWWEEQREQPNRPVMGVCWFEAMAYCKWLTEQVRANAEASRCLPLTAGYVVRLPTEAEWEKAARGEDARQYPWGDQAWDAQRANISDSRIHRPTPVGMYPLGATPSGLLDLAGNVWEWTSSLYRPYPYRSDDGREDPRAEGRRVVRGGAWVNYQWFARCAFRYWFIPVYFHYYVGLRVVVSLALPPAEF